MYIYILSVTFCASIHHERAFRGYSTDVDTVFVFAVFSIRKPSVILSPRQNRRTPARATPSRSRSVPTRQR